MTIRRTFQGLMTLALFAVLSACGGGSGASTVQNPVTVAPNVSNYNGPAPQTADVQSFKLNVWDNLVPNNRCGSCHNTSQTPRFVRADDINLVALGYHYALSKRTTVYVDFANNSKLATQKAAYDFGLKHNF